MFILKCPKCGNKMKYQPLNKSRILGNKTKQCVYCGKSFKARDSVVKESE